MSEVLAHHRLEELPPAAARDPGSFRDPAGFVFKSEGVLYRQINLRGRDEYERFMASGLAHTLVSQGLLVPHEEVVVPFALPAIGHKVIRPESIPFISYPYEWSFGQLRDAALLTLRVQKRAIDAGLSLKDASAFNVQFLRGKPVLIDTLSFEPFVEGQPWVAYRQFCQHFLAPLALMAHGEIRMGQLSRIFLDGVPLDLANALLPWHTRLRPGLGLHVHMHARMQRRHAAAADPTAGRTGGGGMNRRALAGLLENLASVVRGLAWEPAGTEWADYYAGTNYTPAALDAKARLLGGMLDEIKPSTVWDLGANTGRFSRLASARGAFTVAFDLDPAAVEQNYRACTSASDTHLLPLVMNLGNPTPGLGWAGQERQSLAARGPADVVMALALVHHLAIGNNVPLDQIAAFFASLGRDVIVEFVPKSDSQVQRLLASRRDIFDDYHRSGFESAFASQFRTVNVAPVPDTERVLFHLRRRTD